MIPCVLDPIVRARFGARQHHEWDEGFHIWHLFEFAQHCGAQHMVVGSHPCDQDCGPKICICCSSEQMPDAVGAGPCRESVPEWRELFLKVFGKLLCQRFGGEMAKREHPVRIPPSFFVNAISLTEVGAFEMLTGMRANFVSASKSDSKGSVSSDSAFVCPWIHPPWAWR